MVMLNFFSWYVLLFFLGWLSFPFTFTVFSFLPERGFAFSRILGLLCWGYLFWLLTSLGILRNDVGSIILSLGLVGVMSLLSISLGSVAKGILFSDTQGAWQNLFSWIKIHKGYILFIEVAFLLSFAGMSLVRAANPEILGTEKPMELAFINAILRSESFPPHDAWLSGYAISYYYFGYVFVAMLAKLSATAGSIAFNLAVALVFGLSFSGAMGLLRNLFPKRHIGYILLAPLFLLILGNFGGLLEIVHARGLFWQQTGESKAQSTFWQWMDIENLEQPPTAPYSWTPQRYYWWWQSSRVVRDHGLKDNPLEVIDEFPSFSFILGDLHPHVLAIPFAFLSLALALHVFLGQNHQQTHLGMFVIELDWLTLLVSAVLLGGLAFLNTWDFPVYMFMFVSAYLLSRIQQSGWQWQRLREVIELTILLSLVGFLLYLPFYFSFSSQARGFIPNLIFPTRGIQFWVMFAPLLIPILMFFRKVNAIPTNPDEVVKFSPFGVTVILFGLLFVSSLLYGLILSFIPEVQQAALGVIGSDQKEEIFTAAITRRLLHPGTWITAFVLLGLSLMSIKAKLNFLFIETTQKEEEKSLIYIILLILVGVLLVIFPEFFYLRDQFGWRINTIFKFYYQAWLLWGMAAAAVTVFLSTKRSFFLPFVYLTIVIGLLYPTLAVWTKTNGFAPPQGWTLDGAAFYENQEPDDYAAIKWLQTAPFGVIAEAVGGSYSGYARAATFSGLPNVLGWPGHESQWRGGAVEMGTRESDLERLYRTNQWVDALAILKNYSIRYVFVGGLERTKYNTQETLFKRYLTPKFQQGAVTIYETPNYVYQDVLN